MKRKSSTDKLEKKRAAWIARTAEILAVSEQEAATLLATERKQSLRLNPLKALPKDTLHELKGISWLGTQYSWMPEGFSVDVPLAVVRDSEPVARGEAFIQNAASWLPVLALEPKPGETILDVCAAPGGKTSHIAAITSNQAHIWANDSSRARLAKMQSNLDRLGARIERFTLFDAQHLARRMEGQLFDKILIDAPCSGEGLRNIQNDKDVMGWSVAHIKRLQQEQKRIITQAWQLLKPGGILVYSTCTMAPEENEAVINYLLRNQKDASVVPLAMSLPNRMPTIEEWSGKTYAPELAGCLRLRPSETIEAFFVCKLQKAGVTE